MDNLEEIRSRIDEVDAQMTSLFEQRMELVREIFAYKTAHGLTIVDPSREEEIIRRNASTITDSDIREYYVNFQREVMHLSRDWQLCLKTRKA